MSDAHRLRKTELLPAGAEASLARAAQLLLNGGLVGMPTETVYGLAANALDGNAVASIFTAKGRPAWDPLIVHVGSQAMLERVVAYVPPAATTLMRAFWPGPLTLLLPRVEILTAAVTAGRALVAVRMPAHPVALALLRQAELPLAAPSANRFGHISPTTAQHVLDDLQGRIDAVLDAGPSGIGLESTVLDASGEELVIYRPGAISAGEISAITGMPVRLYEEASHTANEPQSLPSPGVGMRHYAPQATLLLAGSERELQQLALAHNRPRTAAMLPSPWQLPGFSGTIIPWGVWADPAALSRELYGALRTAESSGAGIILCPLPPAGDDLRQALRDRLRKAARER